MAADSVAAFASTLGSNNGALAACHSEKPTEPGKDSFVVAHDFGVVDWSTRGVVTASIVDIQASPKPWVHSVFDVLMQYDAEKERDVVWILNCVTGSSPSMFDNTSDVLNCAFKVGYRMAKSRKLLRRVVSEVRVVCDQHKVDSLRSTVDAVLNIIPSPNEGQRQVAVRVMTPEQARQLAAADAAFSGATA